MTVRHVQLIRQAPAVAELYVGYEGEMTVELETFLLRVHDGVTPGGFATLTLETANSLFASLIDFQTTLSEFDDAQTAALSSANDLLFAKFLIARAPVIEIRTALPGSPSIGDRYLLASAGLSGVAAGHENEVAEYAASGWLFSGDPLDGAAVFNIDTQLRYFYHVGSNTWTNVDEALEPTLDAIDAALALKAPLASPAFTGTPTAPTPPDGDSSTKVATTQFVNASVSGDRGFVTVNGANGVSVSADFGKTYLYTGTGTGHTHSMPSAAAVGAGWKIKIKVRSSDGDYITINPSGAETIDGLAHRIAGNGTAVVLISDGLNFYTVEGEYVAQSAFAAFTAGAAITFTHNFGVIPTFGRIRLKCVTTDKNYAVGDIVDVVSISPDNNQGQVNIIHNADGNASLAVTTVDISLANKTTFANAGAITLAKWNLQIQVHSR